MPFRIDDRVVETCSAPGTGAFALAAAVTGFQRFSAITGIAINDTTVYFAESVNATTLVPDGGWEVGIGTYSAANTLTRTTILRSSNSNAAVNFTGTVVVSCGTPASRSVILDDLRAILLPAATAEPPTPAAGNAYLYFRELLPGHLALKIKKPSGIDTPLQDAIAFNNLRRVAAGNALVAIGCAAPTVTGTAAAQAKSTGTARLNTQRIRYTSAATAGALSTWIQPNANNRPVFRGGANGEGGFRYVLRFCLQALQSGNRGFWGLAASTTAATNVDPLTVAAPARVGVGFNVNTGNWFLIRSDGTTPATTDLGANFPLNGTDLMELLLFCRPHDGSTAGDIAWRFRRYTTLSNGPAFETSGSLSANIPAATTLMHPWFFVTNNATAAAVAWEFNSDTDESDW